MQKVVALRARTETCGRTMAEDRPVDVSQPPEPEAQMDVDADALFDMAAEAPLFGDLGKPPREEGEVCGEEGEKEEGEREERKAVEPEVAPGVSPFASTIDEGRAQGNARALGGFRAASLQTASEDARHRKQGILFHEEAVRKRAASVRHEDELRRGKAGGLTSPKSRSLGKVRMNDEETVPSGSSPTTPPSRPTAAEITYPHRGAEYAVDRKAKAAKVRGRSKLRSVPGKRRVHKALPEDFDKDAVIDVDGPALQLSRPSSDLQREKKTPARRTLQMMDGAPHPPLKRHKTSRLEKSDAPAARNRSPSITSRKSKMKTASIGKGTKKPRRSSSSLETLKDGLQNASVATSGGEAEVTGGWNEVPRVESADGKEIALSIPRRKSGTRKKLCVAQSSDDDTRKTPEKEHARQEKEKKKVVGAESSRVENKGQKRDENRKTLRQGRKEQDRVSGQVGQSSGDGWHQAISRASSKNDVDQNPTSSTIPSGPRVNPPVPGMFLFPPPPALPHPHPVPTPPAMPHSHPVPPHGMLHPPQAQNMFIPVVHQNAFFPGAPLPANFFGIPGQEHHQTQWQQEAVKAAWLDHQIQHKQRINRQRSSTPVQVEELKSQPPAKDPDNGCRDIIEREALDTCAQFKEVVSQLGNKRVSISKEKVKPETSKTSDAAQDFSSSDEEDGEDHISTLHVMSQRTRKWSNPKFASDHKDARGRWVCTGTVKLLFKDGDESLKRSVAARSRKKAKQKVSKRLLIALKEMLAEARKGEGSGGGSSPAEEVEDMEKSIGISTAVGALCQLWHRRKLDTQVDTRFEEIGGGRWRCTFIMAVSGIGRVKVSEDASQKKLAKNNASLRALQRLRELKVIRAEDYANLRPCQEEKGIGEYTSMVEKKKYTAMKGDVVQISDDEEDVHKVGVHDSDEGRFLLPKQFSVVIARTSQQCEEWRKSHATQGSEVGVFVDSGSARREFDSLLRDRASTHIGTSDVGSGKVLCFSTKTTSLVVREDKCTDEDSRGKDCVKGFWIPEPVRTLLCDRTIQKHGHNIDDGLMCLRQHHDVQASALSDVAVLSSSSRPWVHSNDKRILHGLGELIKYWLKKELTNTRLKDMWKNASSVEGALGSEADEPIGIAILSAYACTCIQEQIQEEAVHKRTQIYGEAAEFRELSRRLMHSPFAV